MTTLTFDAITFAKAIADETRQDIMKCLCCDWLCVSDVVEKINVSQPTVSHHLGILRKANLVETQRKGKQIYYTLNQDAVTLCCGMLMQTFAPEKVLIPHDAVAVVG